MATVRAKMLLEKYNAIMKKDLISVDQLDQLMYQVDKLMQNYHQTVESRDSWKKKYNEKVEDCKMLSQEIKRLEDAKYKKLKDQLNKNGN